MAPKNKKVAPRFWKSGSKNRKVAPNGGHMCPVCPHFFHVCWQIWIPFSDDCFMIITFAIPFRIDKDGFISTENNSWKSDYINELIEKKARKEIKIEIDSSLKGFFLIWS